MRGTSTRKAKLRDLRSVSMAMMRAAQANRLAANTEKEKALSAPPAARSRSSKGPVSAQQRRMPRSTPKTTEGTPRRPTKEAVRTGMVMNENSSLSTRSAEHLFRQSNSRNGRARHRRAPAGTKAALTTRVRANASALTTMESAAHSAMVGRSHTLKETPKLMSSMADPTPLATPASTKSAAAKGPTETMFPAMHRSVAQATKNAAIARLRRMCAGVSKSWRACFRNTAYSSNATAWKTPEVAESSSCIESASGKRMYCPLNMKR